MRPVIEIDEREAKAQWEALLDNVTAGVSVEILRQGKPIARLIGIGASVVSVADVDDAIRKLRALRATTTLGPVQYTDVRDQGRR